MTPLASSAVSNDQPERRAQECINEWLKSYFDGGRHDVGGVEDVEFEDLRPSNERARIVFNQAPIRDIEGPVIHWHFNDLRCREEMQAGDEKLIVAQFLSTVHVRVAASAEAGKAEQLCRRCADHLRMLLQSPERHLLNQKGIHHIRCESGPVPVSVVGWQGRMLVVRGTLRWTVTW